MIKAGVIGLGAMGKHHARIYSQLPDVELAGVADVDAELASSIARRHDSKSFTDYHELLRQGLDVVSIAVPTSLHRDVVLATAEAGINVLVEKPIADTLNSASQMIEQCDRNEIKLMVGHVERFNPVVPVIKERIKTEEVMLINFTRVGPMPARIKDVGVIIDLATHDIDLARYIIGSRFKDVHSLRSLDPYDKGGREDNALLSFEMENGTLVQIVANWLTPFKVRELSIATRERYIKSWLRDQKVLEYEAWKDDSYLVRELPVTFAEPLTLEIETFLKAVRENLDVPVSGEEGLETLAIALECVKGTS